MKEKTDAGADADDTPELELSGARRTKDEDRERHRWGPRGRVVDTSPWSG